MLEEWDGTPFGSGADAQRPAGDPPIPRGAADGPRRMIASLDGVVGARRRRQPRPRGRAGSATASSPRRRCSRGRARQAPQAPHPPPRPRGPPGPVRLPHRRRAGLLRAAPDGHRGRPEGGPGDPRQPPGRRAPAGDPRRRRGGPHLDQRRRQAARRPDRPRAARRRWPRPARPRRVAGGPAAAPAARREGEVVAALQALGYTLAEAREAARAPAPPRPGAHPRGPRQGRPAGDLRRRRADAPPGWPRTPPTADRTSVRNGPPGMLDSRAMTRPARTSSPPTSSTRPRSRSSARCGRAAWTSTSASAR